MGSIDIIEPLLSTALSSIAVDKSLQHQDFIILETPRIEPGAISKNAVSCASRPPKPVMSIPKFVYGSLFLRTLISLTGVMAIFRIVRISINFSPNKKCSSLAKGRRKIPPEGNFFSFEATFVFPLKIFWQQEWTFCGTQTSWNLCYLILPSWGWDVWHMFGVYHLLLCTFAFLTNS